MPRANRETLFKALMANYRSNRPEGLTMQLGTLSKTAQKKIEQLLDTKIISNKITLSDYKVLHSLRLYKVEDGRAVKESEFISELMDIENLDLYVEKGRSKSTIYLIKGHVGYFNKYVFRINYYDKKDKTNSIALVSAGKVDIRHMNVYIKIK